MFKQLPRLCGRGGVANCGNSTQENDCHDQLHKEIKNKFKACSNPTYECTLPRIDGYEYCIRHILQDPNGNFRQCTFVYFNGRKCPNAVPKHNVKTDSNLTTLCMQHNRQLQLQKTHASIGKFRHVDSNEVLLNNLAHHINVEEVLTKPKNVNCEQDEEIDVVSPQAEEFIPHKHINTLDVVSLNMRKRRRVLDYASDSSSDDEVVCMNNTSVGVECNESDAESVDSLDEDLLKHAGIYTRQEALRISEAKLTKLQSLYMDQINHLHHVLREKRRRYLHAIRREREHLCSIHDQLKETPRERALYDQLKALNSYHRRHGMEAVLYKKFKDKRNRANENYVNKIIGFNKCAFTEGGVKCGDRVLPSSKYCRKHILEDKKQILFKACGIEKSGVVCQEPIPNIFDDSTCVLHLSIPQQRQYVQKKYESEPEEENTEAKQESIDKDANPDSAKKVESNEMNTPKINTIDVKDE